MGNLSVALSYAKNGIRVFPCNEKKAPAIKGGNGYHDASTCEQKITEWWSKYPDAMVGAPNDQFVVLDSDDHDLCQTTRIIHSSVVQKLKEYDIITDKVMKVTTLSGGTHYYYKKDTKATRLIRCLPFFDLLANGGYTILPDQKNYIAHDTDEPWERILDLPKLPEKEFGYLMTDFEPVVQFVKDLKKQQNSDTKQKKPSRKIVVEKLLPEQLPDKNLVKLYAPSEAKRNVDAHEKILVNGKIQLKKGKLTADEINRIFYNREVQEVLGKHLGLKTNKNRSTQRSIFTHHVDKKPSMGVRWSMDNNYLIVRDFAMAFSKKQNESDYDLVRLYTSLKYGRPYKPSKSEFVLWLTRMLHEAKLIDIEIEEIPEDVSLTKNERLVLEALYAIDAYKKLHHLYDGTTVFSVNFAKAWTGVNIGNALSKIKKTLTEKKLISIVGEYDCSAGFRTDGFYNTDLIKVLSKGQEEMANEKIVTQKAQESEVEKKYPDLGTLYSLKVSEKSYKTLKNFCDDFDIKNVPDREYMHVPILVSDSFIADVIERPETQYFVKDLSLFLVDGENGQEMLMCEGKSLAFEEIWNMIDDKHGKRRDDYMDIPVPAFVLSSDIGDIELDLGALELKLNEYINPAIMLNDLKTHYIPNEQMDDVLDGITPEI